MPDPAIISVIVGVGEVVDRSHDPAAVPEPLALMARAARRAEADAGGVLATVDRVTVVHQTSWRYTDTARRFCDRIGLSPTHAHYGPYGGETPVRFLHEAAERVRAGADGAELIVGGEAQHARSTAERQGVALPWTPIAEREENPFDPAGVIDPLMVAHGVVAPAHVYPLFESAWQARHGQTPAEGLAASAELWARYAAVAAARPTAWRRDGPDAATIADPAGGNRWIAWPYTRSMVANPQVNHAAAVLVTSLAAARRSGVAEDRLVRFGPGAWAAEPRNWLARDGFAHSTAQAAVLHAVVNATGAVDLYELYSCFPVVPKMAIETLGARAAAHPTVTGGLSFFGGPFNAHMLHAAVAMVAALRDGRGARGLLYGQGEYLTKHHALALTRADEPAPAIDAQAAAEGARGAVPPLLRAPDASFAIEAATVRFDRAGEPEVGIVVARSDAGRTLARTDHPEAIARLLSHDRTPVGERGQVRPDERGRPVWRFDAD